MMWNLSNSARVWTIRMEATMQWVRKKHTPSHPSFEPAAGKSGPTQSPGWTPHHHAWSLSAHRAASPSPEHLVGRTWARGSSCILHPTLSIAQARRAEQRTQLQPAPWTSLPPRGLHQVLRIIQTLVFSWLILYLLPETVFLGSWIKRHSAPAN